jgi:hypothetical protein
MRRSVLSALQPTAMSWIWNETLRQMQMTMIGFSSHYAIQRMGFQSLQNTLVGASWTKLHKEEPLVLSVGQVLLLVCRIPLSICSHLLSCSLFFLVYR